MILWQKIAFLKNCIPEKGFDIILLLWSKLLLHTWHNKNIWSDEKVLLPEKNHCLKTNKKKEKIDVLNNFVLFHCKEIWLHFIIEIIINAAVL